MRIKIVAERAFRCRGTTYAPGSMVDIDEDTAKKFIRSGWAKKAGKPKMEKSAK